MTNYKSSSYTAITEVNGKIISIDTSSGNILIKDTKDSSAILVDSSGNEDEGKEGATTMADTPDDAHAFVYEDENLIIPYVNYGGDIYLLIIDNKEKKLVYSYAYAKGKENKHAMPPLPMVFKNITPHSSSKSSGNTVSMSSEIDLDVDKDKFKMKGKWFDVRTNSQEPQILDGGDGSFVVSMEGSASTSNYVVFSLFMKDDTINMEPVVLKYDTQDSNDDGSSGSRSDMSQYVPKTWLNPSGCPKCPSSGDCSKCGSSGSSGSPGSSESPGGLSRFGNNLVDKTTGVANNAIGGATALGLGAALGATVLGASAVGGATSLGNNVVGGAAGLGNNAIGGAAGLGNNAIGGATKLGQGVTNTAGQAVGTAGNVLNSTVGTAGGVVNNAVNKLTGLAGGLGTGAKDLLQSGNRTNLQQGQQGQIGANGQPMQGQATPNGNLIVQQPSGQQYAGYQFAFPVSNYGAPIMSQEITAGNYMPFSANADMGTRGNYTVR